MFRNLLKSPQPEYAVNTHPTRRDWGLQVVLWTLWTLVVAAAGYWSWHATAAAEMPTDTIGLVIHCTVVGIIGLVVMTKIEMWVQPWRFLDERTDRP
jgi:hypothetical protein